MSQNYYVFRWLELLPFLGPPLKYRKAFGEIFIVSDFNLASYWSTVTHNKYTFKCNFIDLSKTAQHMKHEYTSTANHKHNDEYFKHFRERDYLSKIQGKQISNTLWRLDLICSGNK
jgi:hypothetical protein